VIDAALNEIKRRLDAARETLVKKAGVSIGVGALATTCGLLTANPLMITAGVGPAIWSSVGAVHKYIEERRDVSMSDMYFLWKAQQHADSQWN
jgi:hypothetical protein